ncbi:MAG: chorismate synthase [Ruminococcaceae bacterium]|nr:chorismate synthase [Oscillospiraceae bacterium]
MKNTFGNALSVTIFGESHGAAIGAVIDGLAPGLVVDEGFIRHQLSLRRPAGRISTARREADEFQILSGVYEGRTTGTPLCIVIPNADTKSGDYQTEIARPGHADYTAKCKYHGYQDARGGGHFSGRVTAALVAAGAILIPALKGKGITIGTHVARCAGVNDAPFAFDESELKAQLLDLNEIPFAVLDAPAGEQMQAAIDAARADGDSVGGVLETAIVGLPAGIGEPWFDSIESLLSHALFSIPAVKGVEFGDGFALADRKGSEANDAFVVEDGLVLTMTNHNGGINGGIANGMPVVFRCAIKPTPTIAKVQHTIDMKKKTNVEYGGRGRHDPCIVHRARVVVDSVAALVVADLLTQRYGTECWE